MTIEFRTGRPFFFGKWTSESPELFQNLAENNFFSLFRLKSDTERAFLKFLYYLQYFS